MKWTPSHEDGKTAGQQTQGAATATVNRTLPLEIVKTANQQTQGGALQPLTGFLPVRIQILLDRSRRQSK